MHQDTYPTASGHRIAGFIAAATLGLMLLALPAMASANDRNDDNIPDRWEKRHGLSLKVDQAKRDQDRDQLVNSKEFRSGMDPRDDDSDGDGTDDSDEGAGTIASYDETTGELTIDVFGGGSITGVVTDDTEVDCDDGDDQGDEDGDDDHSGPGHGDDDEDEDHSGPGHGGDDDEAGDDNGGHGDDEAGDDRLLRSDDDEDDEVECSTADLAVGAIVHEAELELEDGAATWEEIELLK